MVFSILLTVILLGGWYWIKYRPFRNLNRRIVYECSSCGQIEIREFKNCLGCRDYYAKRKVIYQKKSNGKWVTLSKEELLKEDW